MFWYLAKAVNWEASIFQMWSQFQKLNRMCMFKTNVYEKKNLLDKLIE